MKRITALLLLAAAGCSQPTIEGTKITDTDEHRMLYDLVMEYRKAMEERDAQAILNLVSERYYEDNGNADPGDDYGYYELRDTVLPATMEATKEVYLTLEVQDIVVEEESAHVDVRFSSRARIEMPSGSSWDTQRELNRIDFVREDEGWRIVRGL